MKFRRIIAQKSIQLSPIAHWSAFPTPIVVEESGLADPRWFDVILAELKRSGFTLKVESVSITELENTDQATMFVPKPKEPL